MKTTSGQILKALNSKWRNSSFIQQTEESNRSFLSWRVCSSKLHFGGVSLGGWQWQERRQQSADTWSGYRIDPAERVGTARGWVMDMGDTAEAEQTRSEDWKWEARGTEESMMTHILSLGDWGNGSQEENLSWEGRMRKFEFISRWQLEIQG